MSRPRHAKQPRQPAAAISSRAAGAYRDNEARASVTNEDAIEVAVRYSERFNRPAPLPFGISEERIAEVLLQAIRDGEPVPDEFDWWADLPPGAMA